MKKTILFRMVFFLHLKEKMSIIVYRKSETANNSIVKEKGRINMNNRGETNEIVVFLAGLCMLVAGGFMFTQWVDVSSSFGRMMDMGSVQLPTGTIFIPFIIGVVMLFFKPNIVAKLITGLGLMIIVLAIILSMKLTFKTHSLYEVLIMFTLLFGGLGLLGRVLLKNPKKNDYNDYMER